MKIKTFANKHKIDTRLSYGEKLINRFAKKHKLSPVAHFDLQDLIWKVEDNFNH